MSDLQAGCSCGGTLTVFDRAHVALKIDLGLYSTDAILRAAYKLTDRCYVLLDRQESHVTAFVLGKTPGDDVSDCVGTLTNELIDQQLRERLENQFGALRTIIAAQAFAEGNLLEPGRDDADYQQDPQNICKPR